MYLNSKGIESAKLLDLGWSEALLANPLPWKTRSSHVDLMASPPRKTLVQSYNLVHLTTETDFSNSGGGYLNNFGLLFARRGDRIHT